MARYSYSHFEKSTKSVKNNFCGKRKIMRKPIASKIYSWLGACLQVWRLRLTEESTCVPHERAQDTRATRKEMHSHTNNTYEPIEGCGLQPHPHWRVPLAGSHQCSPWPCGQPGVHSPDFTRKAVHALLIDEPSE